MLVWVQVPSSALVKSMGNLDFIEVSPFLFLYGEKFHTRSYDNIIFINIIGFYFLSVYFYRGIRKIICP